MLLKILAGIGGKKKLREGYLSAKVNSVLREFLAE
jgi:hypothetical protein